MLSVHCRIYLGLAAWHGPAGRKTCQILTSFNECVYKINILSQPFLCWFGYNFNWKREPRSLRYRPIKVEDALLLMVLLVIGRTVVMRWWRHLLTVTRSLHVTPQHAHARGNIALSMLVSNWSLLATNELTSAPTGATSQYRALSPCQATTLKSKFAPVFNTVLALLANRLVWKWMCFKRLLYRIQNSGNTYL